MRTLKPYHQLLLLGNRGGAPALLLASFLLGGPVFVCNRWAHAFKRARVYALVCWVLPRSLIDQSPLAARKDEGAAVAPAALQAEKPFQRLLPRL